MGPDFSIDSSRRLDFEFLWGQLTRVSSDFRRIGARPMFVRDSEIRNREGAKFNRYYMQVSGEKIE